MNGGKMFGDNTESKKSRVNTRISTSIEPVECLGEGKAGVSSPPEQQLGGEPGAPADVVDHQHYHQHLRLIITTFLPLTLTYLDNPPPPTVDSPGS